MLINSYKLPYYGSKNWEWLDEAEQELTDFFAQRNEPEPDSWILVEIEENTMKKINVLLRNDPSRVVYLEGTSTLQASKRLDQ